MTVVFALVVLAVIGVLLSESARNAIAIRRMLETRQNQLQSAWLARSGVELAAARLIESSKYQGEVIELIPNGSVRITIENKSEAGDQYAIKCEAHFPATGPDSMMVTAERTFRRTQEGASAKLEFVAPDESPQAEPPAPR